LIFILLIVGGGAVALLAAVGVGVWKFRQSRRAHVAPPQVAVVPQPPPAPSPEAALPATNVPNPEIAPTTPTTSTAPASPAPQVERKTVVRKPKPAAKPQPEAVEPAPAPPPPAPLAVAPPPQPAPAAPSPEAIAKAEAAKFANVPHIVQLQCEYELKEATYTISGGGQTLYQGVFKGKKKGGFMGIKGAYEGSFSHTITVPAGAAEVSVHVTTKDRSIELNKAIPMPSAVGFIPTLDVKVAEDHITLAWQSPPKPKP